MKNIKLDSLLLELLLFSGTVPLSYAEEQLKKGVFDPLPFFNNAERVQAARPQYPRRAMIYSVCGEVRYALSISADGDVLDSKLVYSQPSGVFEAEVEKVISTWKFERQFVGDKSIAYQTVAPTKFILMDEESCPKFYSEQLLKQVRQQ